MSMISGNQGGFAAGRTGAVGLLLALCGGAGCTQRATAPVRITSERLGPLTIAVAPALNHSGSPDVDVEHAADEMAAELTQVGGVRVIPVSRVIGVMQERGWAQVEGVGQALELASLTGADAVLVFAITAYNPYDPPRVGVSAQLIGELPDGGGRLDPVALAGSPGEGGSPSSGPMRGVLAEASAVFDASREDVLADVKTFAARRNAGKNPYGHRWYLVSQRRYLQYCCHATLRSLFGEASDDAVGKDADAGKPADRVAKR